MLRTRARTGPTTVLVLAVAAALLAAPTAAAADELRFPDARGDTRSPADIVGVTLGHGDRVVVRVHHRDLSFQTGEAPATLRVIYAVPGHSPGPDYWLKVAYQSDQTVAAAHARATGATRPAPGCPAAPVSGCASPASSTSPGSASRGPASATPSGSG